MDLSKVTNLKDVEFILDTHNVQWIVTTLQTVKSANLRRISFRSRVTFTHPVEETVRQEWQDLDSLLISFWTSHSICLKFTYAQGGGTGDLGEFGPNLLLKLTNAGIADFVGSDY